MLFTDATSGVTTYPGARSLSVAEPGADDGDARLQQGIEPAVLVHRLRAVSGITLPGTSWPFPWKLARRIRDKCSCLLPGEQRLFQLVDGVVAAFQAQPPELQQHRTRGLAICGYRPA